MIFDFFKSKMKILAPYLVVLFSVSILLPQQQSINQTEEIDIPQIKQKANVDAKADFHLLGAKRWLTNSASAGVAGCCLFSVAALMNFEHDVAPLVGVMIPIGTLGPPIKAIRSSVSLTEERKRELLGHTDEYSRIYISEYERTIKRQRFNSSLSGFGAFGLYVFLVIVLGVD